MRIWDNHSTLVLFNAFASMKRKTKFLLIIFIHCIMMMEWLYSQSLFVNKFVGISSYLWLWAFPFHSSLSAWTWFSDLLSSLSFPGLVMTKLVIKKQKLYGLCSLHNSSIRVSFFWLLMPTWLSINLRVLLKYLEAPIMIICLGGSWM